MKYYRICLVQRYDERYVCIYVCLDDSDNPESIVELMDDEQNYTNFDVADFDWKCDCTCDECCERDHSDSIKIEDINFSSHLTLKDKPEHIDFTSWLTIKANSNPECKLTKPLFEVKK